MLGASEAHPQTRPLRGPKLEETQMTSSQPIRTATKRRNLAHRAKMQAQGYRYPKYHECADCGGDNALYDGGPCLECLQYRNAEAYSEECGIA